MKDLVGTIEVYRVDDSVQLVYRDGAHANVAELGRVVDAVETKLSNRTKTRTAFDLLVKCLRRHIPELAAL